MYYNILYKLLEMQIYKNKKKYIRLNVLCGTLYLLISLFLLNFNLTFIPECLIYNQVEIIIKFVPALKIMLQV